MKVVTSLFPWSDLLGWYREHGRHDLPWRDYSHGESILPYRVWISEIFLQQTQVSRVIGYFDRVIERFPTIESLASTDYEIFFPYYQGLGYYSRARNMLKTAKRVTEEHGCLFPEDIKTLEKLPGVGPYTARAILAFAHGEPYLAWDTNLEKVFARYYHGDKNIKLTREEKEGIEEDFQKSVHSAQRTVHTMVRSINNALMDFAATVDLKNPSAIDWESYPIKSGRWYETRGSLEKIDIKKSESFPIPDASVIVILHKDHKVYYGSPDPVISSVGDSRSREILAGSTTEHDVSFVDMTEKIVYSPFLLPPALHRDTRAYVQEYFRENYSLELSVRPVHKKWISEDGKPYIAVNAQVQTGKQSFREYTKAEAKSALDALG